MKTEQEIIDKIKEIESDERIHQPPAHVDINSPLAIIQIEQKSIRRALYWALDLKAPKLEYQK